MNVSKILTSVLLLAFLTSCGGGGSNSNNETAPAESDNDWDTMQWDRDQWQ